MQHFPIQNIDRSILNTFKDVLKRYLYTHSDFLQRGINPFAYNQFDLPIFANRYPASTKFGILFHLFFLGRKVKLDSIKKIFDDSTIAELLKMRIFEEINSTSLQSSVLILPYKKYYFACDFMLQSDDRSHLKSGNYEPVYSVSLDSVTLSETFIKKPVESVLDLGCGSGFLSIIASRFGKCVTGIDINPRAVNFSTFNACLNNISNCSFICGDLYNPVEKGKFDLILSNPPYEISIKKTNLFQDGGGDGGRILKRIIESAPLHLTGKGFCHIITKMAQFHYESREQIFKKWLKGTKVRLFFLLLYKMSIEQSAYSICTDLAAYKDESMQYKKYSENITKILRHFEKIKLSNISFGLITLTPAAHFKYVEQSFDSSLVLASELSEKLQYIIYRHFVFALGFFGFLYFLKNILIKLLRKIVPFLHQTEKPLFHCFI